MLKRGRERRVDQSVWQWRRRQSGSVSWARTMVSNRVSSRVVRPMARGVRRGVALGLGEGVRVLGAGGGEGGGRVRDGGNAKTRLREAEVRRGVRL